MTTAHDPVCSMAGSQVPPEACRCQLYAAVRRDERALIEKRVRDCGAARRMYSHDWDLVIAAVRGPR